LSTIAGDKVFDSLRACILAAMLAFSAGSGAADSSSALASIAIVDANVVHPERDGDDAIVRHSTVVITRLAHFGNRTERFNADSRKERKSSKVAGSGSFPDWWTGTCISSSLQTPIRVRM